MLDGKIITSIIRDYGLESKKNIGTTLTKQEFKDYFNNLNIPKPTINMNIYNVDDNVPGNNTNMQNGMNVSSFKYSMNAPDTITKCVFDEDKRIAFYDDNLGNIGDANINTILVNRKKEREDEIIFEEKLKKTIEYFD